MPWAKDLSDRRKLAGHAAAVASKGQILITHASKDTPLHLFVEEFLAVKIQPTYAYPSWVKARASTRW